MQSGTKKIILIGIIVIMIAFIMTMCGRNIADNELPAYSDGNRVDVVNGSEDDQKDIETFIYTDDANSFSLSIPKDWKQVNQGDNVNFIHQPTGTAVQIQVLDYDPFLNNMSADNMSLIVSQNGFTYVNFNKVSNSQYEVIYQDYGNTTYDYLEEVYWDRDTVVKLIFVTEDQYYDSMVPYFQEVYGSFVWEKDDPVPDGYSLYYSEAGDMELCIPNGWVIGSSSNALVCYDEISGAQFTVTLNGYTEDLSKATAVDMSAQIRGTKSNFIMQQFIPGTDMVYAITSYQVDGTSYDSYVYMYCNGAYLCMVSYDFPSGSIDPSVITTSASYFRFMSDFWETGETQDTEVQQESERIDQSESSQTPETAAESVDTQEVPEVTAENESEHTDQPAEQSDISHN